MLTQMTRTALLFLFPAALLADYTYYSSNLQNNPASWTINGAFTSADGGSQISSIAVPKGATEYEVKTTLKIKASGGTFITYLRASPGALNGPNAAGSYYAFELADVAVNGASCTATANLYKRVNNEITLLASHPEVCKDGMNGV